MPLAIKAEEKKARVLLLPGWQGSGKDHWQRAWERQFGDVLVEQNDWLHPLRGDWMSRLDEEVQLLESPAILVAHSLGCQLVAAWAAHSRLTDRIAAALLVAPADTERADMSPNLYSWRPVVLEPLAFPSTVVASTDDPYCDSARAELFAESWGSNIVSVGALGHINAQSRLGDWPAGRSLLDTLAKNVSRRTD